MVWRGQPVFWDGALSLGELCPPVLEWEPFIPLQMNTSQVKESLLENLPLTKVTWRGHCSCSKRRARGLVISGLEAEWRTGLFLRMIFLLSLEEEQGATRNSSLAYCRLRGSRSSFLFREVGRGSPLLWDAAVEDLPGDPFPYSYREKLISCRWRGRGALFDLVRSSIWDWRSFVFF